MKLRVAYAANREELDGQLGQFIDAAYPILLLQQRIVGPGAGFFVLLWDDEIRGRWWWGDIDHVLIRLRHSAAHLNLPPDAPSAWRVLREFLAHWRPGDRSEVFRLTYPRPFLRETLQWFMRR